MPPNQPFRVEKLTWYDLEDYKEISSIRLAGDQSRPADRIHPHFTVCMTYCFNQVVKGLKGFLKILKI